MRGKGSMDNNDMNSIQYTENGNSGIVVDTKEEKKQSGLGIASFVMSMVNIAMIISIFVAIPPSCSFAKRFQSIVPPCAFLDSFVQNVLKFLHLLSLLIFAQSFTVQLFFIILLIISIDSSLT